MLKKSIWYCIFTVAIAGLVVLSVGFYQAIMVTTAVGSQPPVKAALAQAKGASAKLAPKSANSLQILILGDSIAKGTGDDSGKGFSGDLPVALKNITPKKILVNDQGINGLKSQGLLQELRSGNFNQTIAKSDFILVSIGGNDLRTILSLNTLAQEDAFKAKLDNYLGNLKQTLKIIKTANPNAGIILLGLYNPYEKITTPEDTRLLTEWNYDSQLLIEENARAIYIPTYDLMEFNLSKYLARDGLHPNSAGYQAFSNRISQSVSGLLPR